MNSVTFQFYGELTDFLPREQRYVPLRTSCEGNQSVKHVAESLGVPHPEIAALLVNGGSVDFRYLVQPGDHIDVYPASIKLNHPLIALRPPLPPVRFVLDTHLGRLAAYLRMLGFDTLYRNNFDDGELAQISHDEQRILLTRDIGLLKRSRVIYGAFVRSTQPEQQLQETARRFKLHNAIAFAQRCMNCNGPTRPVEKNAILHLLEPRTRTHYNDFQQCQTCDQIYWRGSHHARMIQLAQRTVGYDQRSEIENR